LNCDNIYIAFKTRAQIAQLVEQRTENPRVAGSIPALGIFLWRKKPAQELSEGGKEMKKVKITVLKTTLDEELANEYGAEGLTACPMMKEGQVFYADYAKPEGFCDEAWKAIYQYVFALAHGAGKEVFYYGDWIRKPGVAICSCNDGLRPVIFKLEATKEDSEIGYTPVR
jgi:uncharacterized repeat protein (TIGR04076 family)